MALHNKVVVRLLRSPSGVIALVIGLVEIALPRASAAAAIVDVALNACFDCARGGALDGDLPQARGGGGFVVLGHLGRGQCNVHQTAITARLTCSQLPDTLPSTVMGLVCAEVEPVTDAEQVPRGPSIATVKLLGAQPVGNHIST